MLRPRDAVRRQIWPIAATDLPNLTVHGNSIQFVTRGSKTSQPLLHNSFKTYREKTDIIELCTNGGPQGFYNAGVFTYSSTSLVITSSFGLGASCGLFHASGKVCWG